MVWLSILLEIISVAPTAVKIIEDILAALQATPLLAARHEAALYAAMSDFHATRDVDALTSGLQQIRSAL
jgi:hypothetical protein